MLALTASLLGWHAPVMRMPHLPTMPAARVAAVRMSEEDCGLAGCAPKDIPYTYDEYVAYREGTWEGDTSGEAEAEEEENIVDDALLPSDALLTANAVAIPALIEENLMDLPNPKYSQRNEMVLNAFTIGTVLLVTKNAMDYAQPGMSRLTVLRHLPLAVWAAYQRAVTAYPVLVKSALTGFTYVLGDVIAQVVQQQQQILQLGLAPRSLRDNLLRMDFWRYVRSGVAGLLFLGPLAHFYYDWVAETLGHWPTLSKIALDQTLYLSFYNSVYYLTLGWLARRPLLEVGRQYAAQFWQLLKAGWRLWPFVGVITYTVVPRAHRVLFVDVIEIAYSAILSRLTTERAAAAEAEEASVEEEETEEEDDDDEQQEEVEQEEEEEEGEQQLEPAPPLDRAASPKMRCPPPTMMAKVKPGPPPIVSRHFNVLATPADHATLLERAAPDEISVIKYQAPWCRTCRQTAPLLDRKAKKYAKDASTSLSFYSMDLVRDGKAAGERMNTFFKAKNITSMPYVEVYCGGTLVDAEIVPSSAIDLFDKALALAFAQLNQLTSTFQRSQLLNLLRQQRAKRSPKQKGSTAGTTDAGVDASPSLVGLVTKHAASMATHQRGAPASGGVAPPQLVNKPRRAAPLRGATGGRRKGMR